MIYKKKNISKAPAFAVLLTFTGFLVVFNIYNQNLGFGLVWTVLYPVVAALSIGRHWGLITTVSLYLIVSPFLIKGLGIWIDGLWDITGFIRFSVGYGMMLYVIYYLDRSNENAYQQLEYLHKKEIANVQALEKIAITDSYRCLQPLLL